MGQTLYLKSGAKTLASIKIMKKFSNRFLTRILHENTVRFVGDQNGEIYFEIMNHTEYDLTKIFLILIMLKLTRENF